MREFVAKKGGRYTYIEDFNALQDLSLAIASMFKGCNNFVLSGCETSGTSNTNITMSSGYVYINGKIRVFEGATMDLTNPFYIVEKERTESVSYAQNATQQGCTYYESEGTTTQPTDKQYIKITSAYVPRLKDEFFGKYALILDSSFAKQEITKPVQFDGDCEFKTEVLSDGTMVLRNAANTSMLTASSSSTDGAINFTYNKAGKDLVSLVFDASGNLKVLVGGVEKMAVTSSNMATDTFRFNSALSSALSIKDNVIENYADSTENGAVEINKTGYNNASATPRHLNVYDGKGTLVYRVDGAAKRTVSYGNMNEESADEFGLILKETAHTYREPAYLKSIAFKDKDGVILGSLGYSSTSNTDLVLKNEYGDLTLQANRVNITGSFAEGGTAISEKYATSEALTDGLDKKVDKVSGKQLSDENFTSAYKAQLESLKTGSIQTGDKGLVNGSDVNAALGAKLDKSANLSDLNDKDVSRNNLDVYSKLQSDTIYLQKSKKLTDLPTLSETDKLAIRTLIGAAESASYVSGDDGKKLAEEIASLSSMAGTVAKLAKVGTGNSGGISFYQQGYVVCGGGITTLPSSSVTGAVLFTIPSNIGKPQTPINGYLTPDISSNQNNRGAVWQCDARASSAYIKNSWGVEGNSVYVSFCYVADKIPD